MIETAIEELKQGQCVEMKGEDEMDLEPGNLGRIAAFYNVKWETMEMLNKELGS